jgi:DNA modification methylase
MQMPWPIPDGSVQCVVTSPPYYGVRDYQTGRWDGGDPECDHKAEPKRTQVGFNERYFGKESKNSDKQGELTETYREICGKCGAKRIDRQLGIERTPEEYVANLVTVFREIRRVLRKDGTVWCVIGDSYATGAGKVGNEPGGGEQGKRWKGYKGNRGPSGKHTVVGPMVQPNRMPLPGLKPKDLIMIPARVALALQADGWYLRSEVIWEKPNAMPSSAKDRPGVCHEHIFLLAKSRRYFYDCDAVKQPFKKEQVELALRAVLDSHKNIGVPGRKDHTFHKKRAAGEGLEFPENGRNLRTVWSVMTARYAGPHFAVYPEALIKPCILAGTSAYGACAKCGAPYKRVTAKGDELREWQKLSGSASDGKYHGKSPHDYAKAGAMNPGELKSRILAGMRDSVTIGWNPTCKCHCDNVEPCVVLDPFSGSGTSGTVSLRFGRRYIGVDLNENYLADSINRLRLLIDQDLLPMEVA